MSDYIKRENVINTIQKADYIGDNESLRLAFEIDDILSADVVPKDFHDKTCKAMTKRHTEEIQRYMWIPCSERLPKKKAQKYLIFYQDYLNGGYDYAVASYIKTPYGWEFEVYNESNNCETIAWMPLPELYKESK